MSAAHHCDDLPCYGALEIACVITITF